MKTLMGWLVLICSMSLANAQALLDQPADTANKPAAASENQNPALDKILAGVTSMSVLTGIAQEAFARRDLPSYIKVVEKMVELRPYEGEYRFRLAAAYAMQDLKSKSYEQLLALQRQGLYYELGDDPAFENIRGYEVYDYIVEHLNFNKQQFGKDSQKVVMDKPEALYESLAYDQKSNRLLAGSVQRGDIVLVGEDGQTTTFAKPNTQDKSWGIFGLAVDQKRDRLWATTSSVPHFKDFKQDEYGQAALIAFDLNTGEQVAYYPVPQDGLPHLLTNVAVGPGGEVYVSDSLSPAVFRLHEDTFARFFSASTMTSLRGLAVAPNGKYLYFADYELGLFIADIEGQQVMNMSTDPTLNLGGIEGVYYWDGALVVIQNGIQPDRLIRVELSEDGSSITGQHPLSANQPQHADPTFGAINGNELYYIANSQWGKFDAYGRLQGKLDPVIVMTTNLALGRRKD